MDVGVAALCIGVDEGALRLPDAEFRRVRDGVGVPSEEALPKREDGGGGGVANDDGVVDPRLLLRREASPGDEKVFPIGLENESSGEEGPLLKFP